VSNQILSNVSDVGTNRNENIEKPNKQQKGKTHSSTDMAKKKIIVDVPVESQIHRLLIGNDEKLEITEKKLEALEDNAIIYDGILNKINYINGNQKLVPRYCQATKKEFKYFKSMYSSTVWQDKPLFRVPFEDLEHVIIVKDESVKHKNPDIKFIFQISVKLDSEIFKYSKEHKIDLEFVKNTCQNVLEFATDNIETGFAFFKILHFMLGIGKK